MADAGDRACIHGLKFQARALAAQTAETERNQFLVGSLGLKQQENEIHLLAFDEDRFDVAYKIYRHPQEIWALAPCPSQAQLVFSVHSQVAENAVKTGATLWSLEASSFEDRTIECPLKPLLSLGAHDAGGVRQVLWNATGDVDRVVSIDSGTVRLWALEKLKAATQAEAMAVPPADRQGPARLAAAAWNPHSAQQISTVNDCALRGWDLRTLKQTYVVERAHEMAVRTLDYNPNRPNVVATGGDDGFLRIWDTRQPKEALLATRSHTHWLWQVAYNRFHDQLVLTGGSDGRVKLENTFSVSSAATLEARAEASGGDRPADESSKPRNGLVRSYDQHDDSVYAVAWSAGDPWIFASLSYDGQVVINTVPQDQKYKIIL